MHTYNIGRSISKMRFYTVSIKKETNVLFQFNISNLDQYKTCVHHSPFVHMFSKKRVQFQ